MKASNSGTLDISTDLRQVAAARCLTREQVVTGLNISKAQAYALIRRGDLRAIKIGGRGVYRVARVDLEAFIEAGFGETSRWIREHRFQEGDEEDGSL